MIIQILDKTNKVFTEHQFTDWLYIPEIGEEITVYKADQILDGIVKNKKFIYDLQLKSTLKLYITGKPRNL